MTTLLVASGGGHLKQLYRLLPRLNIGNDRLWVTFDTALSRHLLADEDVAFAPYARPHDFVGTLRDTVFALKLSRKLKVERVVSTGANLAVAFLPLCKLLGARAEYIESATRTTGPSMSGQMLQRVRGIHLYTQHPRWVDKRWHFGGSVFDGFSPRAGTAIPPVYKLVVTLGTNETYAFNRLTAKIRSIVPKSTEVLWQTGATRFNTLGAHTEIAPHELETAICEADAVVAHAGTGSALTAMEMGKFPLLVPRRAELGEHVDDHQTDIAMWLQSKGLAMSVDADELTWKDICVAASWMVQEPEPAPPFILDD